VSYANGAASARLQRTPEQLAGVPLVSLVIDSDRAAATDLIDGARDTAVLQFLAADMISFPLSVQMLRHEHGALLLGEPPMLPYLRLGDDLAAHANDLAVQSRERARRARNLAGQLAAHEQSHWHLPRDQEVLPICVVCNRVNTVANGWEDLAVFIARSGRFLSHTYCDQCFPEVPNS